MKVVILCGGKGTRLREETEFRPKPMVPIGTHPILWHIMKTYAAYGFKDFVLCLGYKGEVIKDYFRNYLWHVCDVTLTLGRSPSVHFNNGHAEEDWNVTLAETGEESMTGYRLKAVKQYIGNDEDFLFTYGDGVGRIDLAAMVAQHRRSGKIATLTAVHPPGRFGELSLESSAVRSFNEKPQVEGGFINGGYMALNRRVFDYIPDDPSCTFELDPMRRLAADGQLDAYRHTGFWQPMDTFQEFTLLNRMWRSGQAPWKIW
jgi:glucose-1-phosphate cytidylyltransferase